MKSFAYGMFFSFISLCSLYGASFVEYDVGAFSKQTGGSMSTSEKRNSVLTIGGATKDIYVRFQGADCMKIMRHDGELNYMLFESGGKIEVEDVLYFSGGGSTNSAVSFGRLGFGAACCCIVGEDEAGKLILDDLQNEGVDVSHVGKDPEHATAISFVVNSLHGERVIFAHRSASRFLKKDIIPFGSMKDIDLVYITSLSCEASLLLPEIVEAAKKEGKPVAINPGVSQLSGGALTLRDSLKDIDILILNSDEARAFMVALVEKDDVYKNAFQLSECGLQKPGKNEATLMHKPLPYENYHFSMRKFFLEIFKMGPQIVAVTDGENGVYVATKEAILFHPAFEADVIDALGAGDAFGSCFSGSIAQGYSVEDSLRRGMLNSSSVIGKYGAKPGLLTEKELEEKVKEADTELLQRFTL
jgi:ribokinase